MPLFSPFFETDVNILSCYLLAPQLKMFSYWDSKNLYHFNHKLWLIPHQFVLTRFVLCWQCSRQTTRSMWWWIPYLGESNHTLLIKSSGVRFTWASLQMDNFFLSYYSWDAFYPTCNITCSLVAGLLEKRLEEEVILWADCLPCWVALFL